MKLFKIIPDHRYTYECVKSVVVAAESKDRALELAREERGREEKEAWDSASIEDLSEIENEKIICVDYVEG